MSSRLIELLAILTMLFSGCAAGPTSTLDTPAQTERVKQPPEGGGGGGY